MASNQFVVDLGSLKLSADQRKSINAAIQGAVTKELAGFKLGKRIVLIPIDRWPFGPILDGIVARDFNKQLQGLIK